MLKLIDIKTYLGAFFGFTFIEMLKWIEATEPIIAMIGQGVIGLLTIIYLIQGIIRNRKK